MLENVSQSFFSEICFYIYHILTILCVLNCLMFIFTYSYSKTLSINKDNNLSASYVVAGRLFDR